MICPEYRSRYLSGIERANSLCFNPHKWLLVNFDCSVMWVCDRRALINQLSVTPEFLRSAQHDSGMVDDLRDMQASPTTKQRSLIGET